MHTAAQSNVHSTYLSCERKGIYELLMLTAGMMGSYTYLLRGGSFCNAQTGNVVLMSMAIGQGRIPDGLYYLIPISAYCLGAFVSEILPTPVKRLGLLRWDTCLIAIELLGLFVIGFIPLHAPHQIVQVLINFLASMQYNTFRQMEGIPMATTFCTNHVRQIGIALAKLLRKKDRAAAKRGLVHLQMLLFFALGGTLLAMACGLLGAKAIWLALLPLGIVLGRLLYADLFVEHALLQQTPKGH